MNEHITYILPEDEREAMYETVARPTTDVAREIMNIRGIDLIFKFNSLVELVLSPEFHELSHNILRMTDKPTHGWIMSEFFEKNASVINSMRHHRKI